MPPCSFPQLLSAILLSVVTAEQVPLKEHSPRFPWIRRFASIGDSYSAGLGAGNRLDWLCSRYDLSYPNILHISSLGYDPKRTHQFLACSGATTTDILEKQVPYLEHGIDLLTISGGGNDVGLTPILNNCIYQFMMAEDQDCEDAIKAAEGRITDKKQLYKNITQLVDATKPLMNKEHGMIYITGYAGFFGADDALCDNVTWSVWRDVESDNARQFLTLARRRALNEMVRSVNSVLREVTVAAGPIVRFIDYDEHIIKKQGRYCEAGVQEPDPNRKGLNFYEWNTIDSGENNTEKERTGDDVPKGSFEGDIAEKINKTLQEHPDWEFDPDKGHVNKSKIGKEGVIGDTIHWLLPDSWKRVFHLRPEGHALVARLLVQDLESLEREYPDEERTE